MNYNLISDRALLERCGNCGQQFGKHCGMPTDIGACPNPRTLGNPHEPKFIGGQYFQPTGQFSEE